MVDLELSSRCFHAVSLAWSSLQGVIDAKQHTAAKNKAQTPQDFDFKPAKGIEELTDGDLTQFQWDALHEAWAADSFKDISSMHNSMVSAGYDYSAFFTAFEVTSEQCLGKSVSYTAIKDALAKNDEWVEMWNEEVKWLKQQEEAEQKAEAKAGKPKDEL